MSEITENSSGPTPPVAQTGTSSETQRAFPKIWMIILIGFVAIVFTTVWLGIYDWLNNAIWSNKRLMARRAAGKAAAPAKE